MPVGEPLPTEGWARVIRERHMPLEMATDGLLPRESAWPAGQVVVVSDADGTHRSYFAMPRAALGLCIDLAVEMDPTSTTAE